MKYNSRFSPASGALRATFANYTNGSLALSNAGNYTVIANNSVGSATSAVAILTVYNSAAALLSSSRYTNKQFSFSLSGVTNFTYVVQASTNLTTWANISTNTAPFTFTDTAASNYPIRFYRAFH